MPGRIEIPEKIFMALKGSKISEGWSGPGGSYFTIHTTYDSPYGCFVKSEEENQCGVLYYILPALEQTE